MKHFLVAFLLVMMGFIMETSGQTANKTPAPGQQQAQVCPNLAYCNAMLTVYKYQQSQYDSRVTAQVTALQAAIAAMPSPSPSPTP
jgi:hypothetical protein